MMAAFTHMSYAQLSPREKDSLATRLNELKAQDTTRVKFLSDYSYALLLEDPQQAEKLSREGLALSKKIKYVHGQVYSTNDVANALVYLGKLPEAHKLYEEAFKLAKKHGFRRDIGYAINGMANIMATEKQFHEAIKYFKMGLEFAKTPADSGIYLFNMGYAALVWGNGAECIKYTRQFLQKMDRAKSDYGRTVAYNNIASGFYFLDQLDSALHYANITEAMFEKEGNQSSDRALLHQTFAKIYTDLKQYAKAIKYIKIAIAEFRKFDMDDRLAESLRSASEIYAAAGMPLPALAAAQEFILLNDSLTTARTEEELNELRTRFETDLKEEQIKSLGKEKELQILEAEDANRRFYGISIVLGLIVLVAGALGYFLVRLEKARKALAHANHKLEETATALANANASKDRLYAIIAHDLRSPVVALDGSTELISHYLKKGDADKLLAMAGSYKETTGRLVLLLDNLLNWGLTEIGQLDIRPEPVDVGTLLLQIQSLNAAAAESKGVALSIAQPEEAMTLTTDAKMLQVVVQNLVNNALKFTPQGGQVNLYATQDDRGLALHVDDTGIGMNAGQVQRLFNKDDRPQRKGTAGEKGSGLGMLVVQAFAEQLGIMPEVTSKEGSGTKISLYFGAA